MTDVWWLVVYAIYRVAVLAVDSFLSFFRDDLAISSLPPTFVQAGSSVVLVLVTAWYAVQTWRSTNLARQQMEFEVRRRHTDALQERTGTWRDDFPAVRPTRVALPDDQPGIEDDFTIYPASLENDPYFEDLLENHAEDVGRMTESLAEKIATYERKRTEFVENTNLELDGQLWSLVEPNFYEWLFERIVLIERGVMDEEALKGDLRDAFTDPRVEASSTFYPGDTDRQRAKDVLIFHRTRSSAPNRDDDVRHRLSANRIANVVHVLDALEEYPTAVEASEILDDIEADVEELERQVVRHDEMGQVPGDCEYVSAS